MIQININDIANKVRSTVLTGLNTALTGVITATDTVLEAFGKLQNQISGKVDKAGDTMTGDLTMSNAAINTVDSIGFDTVSPAATISVGEVRWNDTDGTTERLLKGGNIYLQDGEEIVARVVNKTNSNVLRSNYQVVKVTTAQGQRLAVDFAQANNDPSSVDTLGIIAENINNNQEGFITILGQIKDINTTGSLQGENWSDGDVLYLSPTVAGGITNIKPIAPNHTVSLGYVEYAHQNNGKIFVKIQNGYELTELHDVYAPSPTNGQTIRWNTTNSRYENGIFVSSVAALTLGTTGTDLSSTVANGTTTPVITLNVPTASASNRGALSSTDWSTFNNKVSTGVITGSGLTMATSRLLGRTTAGSGAVEEISIGSGLTLSGGTLASTGGGITVGTTPVTSGTVGRIFFQGTGDVVQQDSTLFWDNTNKRLGVGATPASTVRLDVRAQGALSTDIAFRVRNSADTVTLLDFQGTGNLITRHNGSGSSLGLFHRTDTTGFSLTTGTSGYGTGTGVEVQGGSIWVLDNGSRTVQFSRSYYISGNDNWQIFNVGDNSGFRGLTFGLDAANDPAFVIKKEKNVGINTSLFGTNAVHVFGIKNGTAPSSSPTDIFQLYSADITAGNAAPHFRTENGDIVKLYRVGGWGLPTGTFTRTTFDTATVTTAQLAERVAALIQDLRDNHGLLKA